MINWEQQLQQLNKHQMKSDQDRIATQVNQQQQQNESSSKSKTSWSLFFLFSYLYFIQGAILGLIGTMPYIYPQLPDIQTMALFNSITLPYSLKFIVAPFLEKFSHVQYGKRKTWIVISQICAGAFLLIGSFYTSQDKAKTFAMLCFIIQIWMVVQNIALHSLIVKQIPSPHESSLIQSYAQVLGILVGGLLLLKLTSAQFANSIGLKQPILNPQAILIFFVLVIFVPVVLIHLFFKERVLKCEQTGSTFSFCQILKNYKVFIQYNTKYFRFCMIVLFYNQGLNFFSSLYDYQLVEAGFSRNTSNTIGNIVIIPIILLTFYFGKWTESLKGTQNAVMFCTLLTVFICFYILVIFPTDVPSIAIINFLLSLLDAWRFYSFGVLINGFPLHALSGMFITVLGSYFNFGRLTFLHTYLCGQYGWKQLSYIGLALQIVIVGMTPKLFAWMERGDLTLPSQISQIQQSGNVEYKEMQEIE